MAVMKSEISLILSCLESSSSSSSSSNSSDSSTDSDADFKLFICKQTKPKKRKIDRIVKNTNRAERQVRKVEAEEREEPELSPLDQYSVDDFHIHFHMKRSTVEFIIESVGEHIMNCNRAGLGRPTVNAYKQVLMSIWTLTKQDTYRSIADRFGVTKQTAWNSSLRFWRALLGLSSDFISWPEGERVKKTANGFKRIANFPGVIGTIGGCPIPIKTPKKDPALFVNRRGFHSITLQAVCDERSRFTNCHAGYVGSIADEQIYTQSDLRKRIKEDPDKMVPDNVHLLGNSAYPLSLSLLTPYDKTEQLSTEKMRYNDAHAESLKPIKRAFCLLKGRFRRLLLLDMWRTDLVPVVVIASCVLHNICELQKDFGDHFSVDLPNSIDGEVNSVEDLELGEDFVLGCQKRDNICERLSAL